MGPRFESVKVHQWPIGQVVKTAASHAVNIGSNPVWVTNSLKKDLHISVEVCVGVTYFPGQSPAKYRRRT